VREAASDSAYAGRFDLTDIGPERLSNSIRAIALPVTRVPWFPANMAFLSVAVAGWGLSFRRSPRESLVAAVVLASLPVGAALLYAGWPAFPGYYAMPFALAMSVILALALSALPTLGQTAHIAGWAGVAIVAVYGLALTWNGAQADRAIREMDFAAATTVASLPGLARVYVGVPDPARSGGVARALLLYATAVTGRRLTAAGEDIACDAARSLPTAQDREIIVLFSHLCDGPIMRPLPSKRHVSQYVEINWKTLIPRLAEMRVTVYGSGS
jgi:hypothetical protein